MLPGISTEQLRSRLNRMVADGMLTRKRYREVPPRVDYELTPRAQDLMPILGELARWGYEWAWSAPRASERVDLGAIFRLVPGLISAEGLRGSVEFQVTNGGKEGGPACYSVTLTQAGASVSETQTESPDALVSGDTAAWIEAFAPGQDRDGLTITGDATLARTLMGLLIPAQQRREEEAQRSAVA